MKLNDTLAFMPLRYLLPMVWTSVVLLTALFSYIYVEERLNTSLNLNMTKHMSQRLTFAKEALKKALNMGLNEKQIADMLNTFEFEGSDYTIMGYLKADNSEVLISTHNPNKGLAYYWHKDFSKTGASLDKVRSVLCQKSKRQHLVWANEEAFYLFMPLSDSCSKEVVFLRFSMLFEREEHMQEMLGIIAFYTAILLIIMFIVGLFSYSVISYRLSRLLKLISGHSQGVSNEQKHMGGNDELAQISKAFCEMSHKISGVLDDMYTFVALLSPKGEILFVNNTPLKVSDLEVSDVKGKKLSHTYWWEYDLEVAKQIEGLIERCIEGEIIHHETQIQIAAKALIWINFSMHPVYNAEGEVEHLVAEGVDISRQKQAYEDLLRQSRKAQMGEMISVIAHQWRQPLSVITALTNKTIFDLELGYMDKDDITTSMHKIDNTVSHLVDTMTQFTNFFNPNKESKKTSFKVIVEKSMAILGSKFRSEGINIEINLEESHPLYTYEEELMQVVMDMMKNSADFFKINHIQNATLRLQESVKDGFVCLSIEDNAGGIKDGDMEKLFQPYFSTKPQEGGTGLGLHMSKMIVEDHCSGNIEVEQLKDGARFRICIPRV